MSNFTDKDSRFTAYSHYQKQQTFELGYNFVFVVSLYDLSVTMFAAMFFQ